MVKMITNGKIWYEEGLLNMGRHFDRVGRRMARQKDDISDVEIRTIIGVDPHQRCLAIHHKDKPLEYLND